MKENFSFYKNIKTDNSKVKKASLKLHNLYNKIPDTKGCFENISKEKVCGGWCCELQTPQLLYSEFLNLWHYISSDFCNNMFMEFLKRSMYNSVLDMPTKGCIFFDKDKKICSVHKKRPYNCRIYGITPDQEFKPRLEKLRKSYEGVVGAVFKDQCNLISTCGGEEVTEEDTNRWWNELVVIEKSIGIEDRNINDNVDSGSYRAPHDHLLLYLMPNNVLSALSGIRLYDNYKDKVIAIEELIFNIKNFFGG